MEKNYLYLEIKSRLIDYLKANTFEMWGNEWDDYGELVFEFKGCLVEAGLRITGVDNEEHDSYGINPPTHHGVKFADVSALCVTDEDGETLIDERNVTELSTTYCY